MTPTDRVALIMVAVAAALACYPRSCRFRWTRRFATIEGMLFCKYMESR